MRDLTGIKRQQALNGTQGNANTSTNGAHLAPVCEIGYNCDITGALLIAHTLPAVQGLGLCWEDRCGEKRLDFFRIREYTGANLTNFPRIRSVGVLTLCR
jgi:hypothetical protein